jgi:hypothetical protein
MDHQVILLVVGEPGRAQVMFGAGGSLGLLMGNIMCKTGVQFGALHLSKTSALRWPSLVSVDGQLKCDLPRAALGTFCVEFCGLLFDYPSKDTLQPSSACPALPVCRCADWQRHQGRRAWPRGHPP